MNAERLLEHYARIADAPDAIARLRRFILDLAVRGKLVPQDPNDEPASVLMAVRIRAKMAQCEGGRKAPVVFGVSCQVQNGGSSGSALGWSAANGWSWSRYWSCSCTA